MLAAVTLVSAVALAPRMASAEGIFDFFFGGFQKQQRQGSGQANFFTDPFGLNQQPAPPPRPVASGSGPAFCVRSRDGKYFPLARGHATPVQMCQAFCPATATKVFFGSSIDGAYASNGERYADSENAFAYGKPRRRAARDLGAEDGFDKGEAGGSGINRHSPLMVRSATSRVSNHEDSVGACSHPSRRRATVAPQDEGRRKSPPHDDADHV